MRRSVSSNLYEGVSRSVVGDGEAQSVFGFINLHLLLIPSGVGEDKILEADLAPQQLVHVDLVGVEGTEQDLQAHSTEQTCSERMIRCMDSWEHAF